MVLLATAFGTFIGLDPTSTKDLGTGLENKRTVKPVGGEPPTGINHDKVNIFELYVIESIVGASGAVPVE